MVPSKDPGSEQPLQPEVLRPEPPRGIRAITFSLTPLQTKVVRWAVVGSAVGFAGYWLQNFFQLRGFVDLVASLISLVFIWSGLSLAVWVALGGIRSSPWRILCRLLAVSTATIGVFALNHFAKAPQSQLTAIESIFRRVLREERKHEVMSAPVPKTTHEAPASPERPHKRAPNQAMTGFMQMLLVRFRPDYSIVEAGRQLQLNAFFADKGSEPLRNVFAHCAIIFVDQPGGDADSKALMAYEPYLNQVRADYRSGKLRGAAVGVTGGVWGTFPVTIADQKEADQLLSGDKRLYLLSWAAWQDYKAEPIARSFVGGCRSLPRQSLTSRVC